MLNGKETLFCSLISPSGSSRLETSDNLSYSQIQAAWEIFQSFLLQHDFFPMILFLLKPNILSPEVKIFSSGPCRDLSNWFNEMKMLAKQWVCSYSLSPKHLIKSGLLCPFFKYSLVLYLSAPLLIDLLLCKIIGFLQVADLCCVGFENLSNWFDITEIFFFFPHIMQNLLYWSLMDTYQCRYQYSLRLCFLIWWYPH